MCGPMRGRFRAVELSASGSYVFVIGRRGDMWTRFYDFDIAGHDPVFFQLLLRRPARRGRRRPDPAPGRALGRAAEDPGRDHVGDLDREDRRSTPCTASFASRASATATRGYWERDVADPPAAGWTFHRTDLPLTGKRLANPARRYVASAASRRAQKRRYVMRADGVRATLRNFNVYCSPVAPDRPRPRQRHPLAPLHRRRPAPGAARGRGLDDQPREQYGAIRRPDGSFQKVTVK